MSESDEFSNLTPLLIEKISLLCLKPLNRCGTFWEPDPRGGESSARSETRRPRNEPQVLHLVASLESSRRALQHIKVVFGSESCVWECTLHHYNGLRCNLSRRLAPVGPKTDPFLSVASARNRPADSLDRRERGGGVK